MPCVPIRLDGNTVVMVCTSRATRKRCSSCGTSGADRECDWPGKQGRTSCNAKLCRRCRRAWLDSLAIQPEPAYQKNVDRCDLCPSHFAAAKAGRGRGVESLLVALECEREKNQQSAALSIRILAAETPEQLREVLTAAVVRARGWMVQNHAHPRAARIGAMMRAMENILAGGEQELDAVKILEAL